MPKKTNPPPPILFAAGFADAVTAAVAARFGLADPGCIQPPQLDVPQRVRELLAHGSERNAHAGAILALTGASGGGKTRALHELAKDHAHLGVLDLDTVKLDPSTTPATQVAKALRHHDPRISRRHPLHESGHVERLLNLLSRCGLGEAHLLVRPARTLSQGETFRLKLALALARQPRLLIIDEFGAVLDDVVAAAVAGSLRKLADRLGLHIMVAAPRDDFVPELQPDLWWRFKLGAPPRVATDEERAAPRRLVDEVEIVRGERRHWPHFAQWHYRAHTVGITSDIFLLRHKPSDEEIGIAIYSYPALQASQRNAVFGRNIPFAGTKRGDGSQKIRARWFNANFRVLHRLVLDPRFRGAGLGAHLVRETVGELDVPFVECFTSLGGYSGFLQAAGFTRYEAREPCKHTTRLVEALAEYGFASSDLEAESIRRAYNKLGKRARQQVDDAFAAAFGKRLAYVRPRYRGLEYAPGLLGKQSEQGDVFVAALRELVLTRAMVPFYFLWTRDEAAARFVQGDDAALMPKKMRRRAAG